jgi:hypothetical protein
MGDDVAREVVVDLARLGSLHHEPGNALALGESKLFRFSAPVADAALHDQVVTIAEHHPRHVGVDQLVGGVDRRQQ